MHSDIGVLKTSCNQLYIYIYIYIVIYMYSTSWIYDCIKYKCLVNIILWSSTLPPWRLPCVMNRRSAPRATLTHFSCSPNFPRASITRYTHAKHEKILKYPNNCVYVALRCAFMETWSAWKVLRSLKKLHLLSATPQVTSLSLSKLPVYRPWSQANV